MFNEIDIIVRTEKGQRICSNANTDSALPRRLRTVLLAVDGDTPFAMYRKYLKSFGDIDALFECLAEEGLIKVA